MRISGLRSSVVQVRGDTTMQRYSRLWWASILLSSVVTGGGSFVLLTLLTGLSLEIVIKICLLLVFAGDILLAVLMEAVSPTSVTVGPGERRHRTEAIAEFGTVDNDFHDRRGSVSVRGERWRARQADDCSATLRTGATVQVLGREGLTLVVKAA